jgi:AraC-like DNA-binding protein
MVGIANGISRRNLQQGTPWPPLSKLKILAAGTKVEPPGATFGPRRQFCWEFIWVREGSLSARIDGVAIEGTPGTVLLIPPGVIDVYDWSRHSRTSHSFMHFDFEPPPHGWPARPSWPLLRQLRQTHAFLALFEHLIGVVLDSEPLAGALALPSIELMLRLYLLEAPDYAVADASLPQAVERCLVYTRRYIAESPGEPLTLGRLAEATHLSPQHLCRVFKSSLGLRPMEVVRLLRIDHSVTYLERTQLQVKEVAHQCGFANAFHYSKVFRAAFEMSPSDYRKAFRRGHVVRTISPVLRSLAAQRILVDEAGINDYIDAAQSAP